jgi:hypothetical protein
MLLCYILAWYQRHFRSYYALCIIPTSMNTSNSHKIFRNSDTDITHPDIINIPRMKKKIHWNKSLFARPWPTMYMFYYTTQQNNFYVITLNNGYLRLSAAFISLIANIFFPPTGASVHRVSITLPCDTTI